MVSGTFPTLIDSLLLAIESAFWTVTTNEGPDVASDPFAFDFQMGGGTQSRAFKSGAEHFAWAVRDGDVAGLSSVPEPTSLSIFGIGVLGSFVAAILRPKRRQAV